MKNVHEKQVATKPRTVSAVHSVLVEGEARKAVTPVRQKCHIGVQALRRGGNMAEPPETDGLKNTLL